MNQGFFSASVAASQQQQRLNVMANNLANVNTVGFKAERPAFSDLLYQNLNGVDGALLPRGAGAKMMQAPTDFEQGALQDSAYAQDYAIEGRGFFAVRDGRTNEISYTRAGAFHMGSVNANGQTLYYLADSDGRFVLDQNEQPIPMNDENARYPVGVFDFANTDGMQHVGDTRFQPVAKNGPVQPAQSVVVQKMLEASNTDVGGEFGRVVETQRAFSYALKMVQVSDEVQTTINGLRG